VPKKHSLDRIFNACGLIPEKTDMVGRSASTSSIWFAVISTTTNANPPCVVNPSTFVTNRGAEFSGQVLAYQFEYVQESSHA